MSEEAPLVTVFASGDSAEIIVAKLLLEASEVPFVVVGDGLQDMFGLGRLTGGSNLITGPVQIRVPASEAEYAMEVLADVQNGDDAQ